MIDLSLPGGLRDLLPDASARLIGLGQKLRRVFARAGYREVVLPTLERLEVVERGLSAQALGGVLKAVEPGSGEVVAVRPDFTPQIARLYAARGDALPAPARLAYEGPVLRAFEARAGRPREVHQAGVELLGAGGPAADAEAVAVLRAALDAIGLSRARLEVGHAAFAPSVLAAARLPRELEAEAHEALARKDEAALAALAKQGRGPSAARAAVPLLATLYGPAALAGARRLARLAPGAGAALREVEDALRLARRRKVADVALDLGESRGLGYYTGLTFAAYAAGAGSAVAAGGRYDALLARFGRPGPAIGFAVDLEFALEALSRRGSRWA